MESDLNSASVKDAVGLVHNKRAEAKRDIRRLKLNWLFVTSVVIIRALNHSCPLPTNHQFIINPTAENLNITSKDIQPGLQQTETFYSLTYAMFYLGHVLTAILVGYLANIVPTWYLFMASIVIHTVGYSLYALSTTGWMMLVSRILAGISMGAVIATSFAYFGVSTARYAENLITLGEYDPKKYAKVKGFVYSLFNIGTTFGYIAGALFPIVLAQFDVDQFRPPGWFCAGIGIVLFLLQLILFRGECKCFNNVEKEGNSTRKEMWNYLRNIKFRVKSKFIVSVGIPLYVLLVGGVKGARFVIPDMLVSPILADSFGFSGDYISYFFLFVLGGVFGTIIVKSCTINAVPLKEDRHPPKKGQKGSSHSVLSSKHSLLYFTYDAIGRLMFQACGFRGYFLTVVGGVLTMSALLLMTDWQALQHDPCTELSLLHNNKLTNEYEMLLSNNSEATIEAVDMRGEFTFVKSPMLILHNVSSNNTNITTDSNTVHCEDVSQCPVCNNITGHCKQLEVISSSSQFTENASHILCQSNSSVDLCFVVDNKNQTNNSSLLFEVYTQSLKVVKDRVYELAVEKCESTDGCHWIPNSHVTQQHCHDCQPICRNLDYNLNFIQFTVGFALLMCTMEVMYIGVFLLLSDSVSQKYQGICAGAMVASIGTARSTAPLWLDFAYEGAGKRTYLPMLILFSLIFTLWIGVLILYPWLGGKQSYAHLSRINKESSNDSENEEKRKLIEMSNIKKD